MSEEDNNTASALVQTARDTTSEALKQSKLMKRIYRKSNN